MIARIAISSICTALTLLIAVRSNDERVRTSAAFAASCLVSFSATSILLERRRQRKSRLSHADVYIEMLRQMNREQRHLLENQVPQVCQGCVHYHGRTYGGERLICGMHPYGVDTEDCGDWQGSREQ